MSHRFLTALTVVLLPAASFLLLGDTAWSADQPEPGAVGRQHTLTEELQRLSRRQAADRQRAAAEAASRRQALAARARASRAAPAGRVTGDWHALIDQYPWDDAVAYRIMMCESEGNANAHNPSGANGLFQILNGPFDPAANVATAYRMYSQRGWQPWTSSRSCWA